LASGQTGAGWQRAALAVLQHNSNRQEALASMLDLYLKHAGTGRPVHTWPVPGLRAPMDVVPSYGQVDPAPRRFRWV